MFTAAIFTTAAQMSVNSQMDEEKVVHMYNGILLSNQEKMKSGHLRQHAWT